MSFKPLTEKIKKKKIGICSILGQNRTRIHHPGSGSADPDPHRNETDPNYYINSNKQTPLPHTHKHNFSPVETLEWWNL